MTSNVIPMGTNYRFRVDSIWLGWAKKSNDLEKKQVAFICLQNKETLVELVHPISEFIMENWKYSSYNTQRKHALNTTVFLNYLLEERNKYKLKSLLDLELQHAEDFLNKLTKAEKSRETVSDHERTISKLYRFLSSQSCLPKVNPACFQSYINQEGETIHISPFKNVILPAKISTPHEHSFPSKYLPLLFEIATLIAKPIALGIYLQIFGGLRVGEVVNIKRTSMKQSLDGHSLLLNIKESFFRTDIKDGDGANYVKKPRPQQVFILKDWFTSLYEDHISIFKPTDGTNALFVNRDGKAMSAKSYRQHFDKVKKYFIKVLKQSPNIDDKLLGHHLSVTSWSTHIGRGIFSNMLAEIAQNPYDIAVPRGDDSLLSALTYLKKTTRFREKLEDRLNSMQNRYLPRLLKEKSNDVGE